MLETYERVFGEKPTGYSSPLEKWDCPELELSPELDYNGRAFYMSLVKVVDITWPIRYFLCTYDFISVSCNTT